MEEVGRGIAFAKRGLELGEYEYAAEICKEILNRRPSCVEARRVLQDALKELYGRKGKLWKLWSWVVSYAYMVCGVCAWRKGSVGFLERALWNWPTNKVGLIVFGQSAMEKGWLDVVIFIYEELCLVCPNEMKYGLALGRAYINLGDYKNGLRVGERLLEKNPLDIEAMELVERATLAGVMSNGKLKN